MKKITAGLGFLLVSTLVLGSQQAFASVEQPEAISDATVLFETNNDKEPPIITPGGGLPGIVIPEESDVVIGDGAASFNVVVSNFRFNEFEGDRGEITNDQGKKEYFKKFVPIKLNADGMTLYAKGTYLKLQPVDENNQKDTTATPVSYENIPNFAQVTDNRGASEGGWNLQVTATDFVGTDKTDPANPKEVKLTGAELTLNDVSINGPADVEAPTTTIDPLVHSTTVLNASSKVMMDAAKNTGTGSWSLQFGEAVKAAVGATPTYDTLKPDTGVKLVIPAKAQTKAGVNYTSKITWTLSNGPSK